MSKKYWEAFKKEAKREFTTRTKGKTFIDVMEIFIIIKIAEWAVTLF